MISIATRDYVANCIKIALDILVVYLFLVAASSRKVAKSKIEHFEFLMHQFLYFYVLDPACLFLSERCATIENPSNIVDSPIKGKNLLNATNSVPIELGSLAATVDWFGNILAIGGHKSMLLRH